MTDHAKNSASNSILIVGAGIGGMQSALLLAEAGYPVVLVDSAPGIGGSLHLLDRTFPTDSCGICYMVPGRPAYCPTIECDLHPNITIVPYTDVVGLEGEPGAFTVRLHHKPRYVIPERCILCGKCARVCPVERPSQYEGNLAKEKAIYRPPLRAIPPAYVIDMSVCTRCGKCVEVCPTEAIDLGMPPTESQLQVGAVVLSPGFEPFDARLKGEFGWGYYPNVLTSIQFERMVSFAGSTRAHLVRPSDGQRPRRIAFIQCVGSRDMSIGRGYCSSVCCMHTAKHVRVVKELEPDTEITVFFMDIRTHGKDYEAYFEETKALPGVMYRRSMVSSVHERPKSRNVVVNYVAEDGTVREEEFDLVVLVVGFGAPLGAQALGRALGVDLNEYGFAVTDPFAPDRASRPGVFVAGAFREPKDIPETVVEASAVAAAAAATVKALGAEAPGAPEGVSEERDVTWEWPRVGVFLCDHRGEIGEVIDLEAVADHIRALPNVARAQVLGDGFSRQGLEEIARIVREERLNRVVLAGYTDIRRTEAYQEMMAQAGLNPNLLELVNLRGEVAGAHARNGKVATEKARELVAMAVAGAVRREPFRPSAEPLSRRVLVVGGGPAGMTAALTLADLGYSADLVERTDALGGQLRDLHLVLGGGDPQAALTSLLERLGREPRVRVLLGTEVRAVSGRLGQFRARLVGPEGEQEETYGAVIVATGGREVVPTEYLYGQDSRVVTQRELEKMLAEGKEVPSDVVMVQCVGSREPGRPYCSRICCTKAVVNALAIKERNPTARVTVLYREMRTYGFREDAYRLAREKGVVFLRYELPDKPQVTAGPEGLTVRLVEPIAGQEVVLPAGLLVLSTGIEPNDNRALAEALGVPVDAYGFFREEHPKMRPLDFTRRGIFVCGLAHSPRAVDETVLMARGAAMRATALLARGQVEVVPDRGAGEHPDLLCLRALRGGVPVRGAGAGARRAIRRGDRIPLPGLRRLRDGLPEQGHPAGGLRRAPGV
jgi:Heterodisulfide reductase, subunit A and related polyferredoxins